MVKSPKKTTKDASERPHVGFAVVNSRKHLRRDRLRRSDDRFLLSLRKVRRGAQVSQLDAAMLEEDVLQLDVSVDRAVRVQIGHHLC